MKTKHLIELRRIAEAQGIEVVDHAPTGSGHTKVWVRKDGVTRFFICANSPSDHRQWKSVKLNMRNVFTEAGIHRRD